MTDEKDDAYYKHNYLAKKDRDERARVAALSPRERAKTERKYRKRAGKRVKRALQTVFRKGE